MNQIAANHFCTLGNWLGKLAITGKFKAEQNAGLGGNPMAFWSVSNPISPFNMEFYQGEKAMPRTSNFSFATKGTHSVWSCRQISHTEDPCQDPTQ